MAQELALCVGGPLEGRALPVLGTSSMKIPGAKFTDRASGEAHVYKWEGGQWVYAYTEHELTEARLASGVSA
jgi:hypothetical protein